MSWVEPAVVVRVGAAAAVVGGGSSIECGRGERDVEVDGREMGSGGSNGPVALPSTPLGWDDSVCVCVCVCVCLMYT